MGTSWKRFVALAAGVLCLWAGSASANPISLYDTGLANDGVTLLAAGASDPHYEVVYPGGATGAPVVHDPSAWPLGASPEWLPNTATSQWIEPVNPSADGPTIYQYKTSFNLAAGEVSTAQISGKWSMDDIGSVSLNGGPASGVVAGGFGGPFSTPFSFNSGFVPGLNTLTFTVNDTNGAPTGLQVQLSGATTPTNETPEPSTLALFGFGIAAAARYRRRGR